MEEEHKVDVSDAIKSASLQTFYPQLPVRFRVFSVVILLSRVGEASRAKTKPFILLRLNMAAE